MGEKVYKPIIREGDHLILSKENPNRVRGLTRDRNNQNPDIIEWEEYDEADLRGDDYVPSPSDDQSIRLTPEEEKIAQQVGEVLGAAVVAGFVSLFREIVSPWWKNTAWPWVIEKCHGIKTLPVRSYPKNITTTKAATTRWAEPDRRLSDISLQIDRVFEQFYFEIDEVEAKDHMVKLIYHMLGVVNEIRIISNARIREDCKSEELCIERQKELEKFLTEKVATNLDQLLSNKDLRLGLNTSKELFSLTGGGVRLNGDYVPVQAIKIDEALKAISMSES